MEGLLPQIAAPAYAPALPPLGGIIPVRQMIFPLATSILKKAP